MASDLRPISEDLRDLPMPSGSQAPSKTESRTRSTTPLGSSGAATFDEYQAAEIAYIEGKIGQRLDPDQLQDLLPVLHLEYEGRRVTDPLAGITYQVWCFTCHDTRWINVGRGRMKPCTRCPDVANVQSRQRLAALAVSGLPTNREPRSLDTFDPAMQTGDAKVQAQKALDCVRRWCAGDLSLLLLAGSTGVGKTHLLEGAADQLIRTNQRVDYILGGDFTHQMRPRGDSDVGTEGTRFQYEERLMKVQWLILDEVGSAHSGGWIQSQYQDIVLYRTGQGLPTLLAGNIGSPDQKKGMDALTTLLGDRLASRLAEGKTGQIASLWRCRDVRPDVAFQKGVGR